MAAKPRDGAVSVAMLRALTDLARGPVFSQPSSLYFGEQPGRMFIRRRTVQALYNCGFADVYEIAPGRFRADLTETGRAFFQNHPLRRELQAAA
jgi:hypothetical protein